MHRIVIINLTIEMRADETYRRYRRKFSLSVDTLHKCDVIHDLSKNFICNNYSTIRLICFSSPDKNIHSSDVLDI